MVSYIEIQTSKYITSRN